MGSPILGSESPCLKRNKEVNITYLYHCDCPDTHRKMVCQENCVSCYLICVMLKGDDGKFLHQFTNLIFGQNMQNALPFFDIKGSQELRFYYEFQSAGMAAFIIK